MKKNVKKNKRITITIIEPKISKYHNDSVWYEGAIASVKKPNGTKLLLIADGDIRIHSDKGELVFDGKERNGGIKGGFKDDRDLKKIGNDYKDKYHWENNNWFEVLFMPKGSDTYDSDMGVVAYNYDDAIRLLKDYYNDDTY